MYFLRTVKEGKFSRLRPLSGQILSGNPVDASYNCQGDKAIRERYPIGTTFVCSALEAQPGFYRAVGDIRVLNESAPPHEKATPEEFKAYEAFLSLRGASVGASYSTPKAAVKKSRTFYDKMVSNDAYKPPTIADNGFYVNPEDWYYLLRNVLNGFNTIIYGPTGTGKTELAFYMGKVLEREVCDHDMSAAQDPVAFLLGVHRIEDGDSVFDYSPFAMDVQKKAIVLMDELNRAPLTANNILFPVTDSRKKLPVGIASSKGPREIKIHDDCCFIATANIGAEYSGTNTLDRALQGRFLPLELDYLPESIEQELLVKRTGVEASSATKIVKISAEIRKLYKDTSLSATSSTRESLRIAELVSDGFSLKYAAEKILFPLFGGDAVDGERSTVKQLLLSL